MISENSKVHESEIHREFELLELHLTGLKRASVELRERLGCVLRSNDVAIRGDEPTTEIPLETELGRLIAGLRHQVFETKQMLKAITEDLGL